jgi:indolepyruvate ferredoxin oxidoreductase
LHNAEQLLPRSDGRLSRIAAKSLHKAMAYKDEYEVARLYCGEDFQRQLRETFTGNYRLRFHMAPPGIARADSSGRIKKIEFGPWMGKLMPLLAKGKQLRGTPLDPFGYTRERRAERAWARQVERAVMAVAGQLRADNFATAMELLELPQQIRGYGHVRQSKFHELHSRWAALYGSFNLRPDSFQLAHPSTTS